MSRRPARLTVGDWLAISCALVVVAVGGGVLLAACGWPIVGGVVIVDGGGLAGLAAVWCGWELRARRRRTLPDVLADRIAEQDQAARPTTHHRPRIRPSTPRAVGRARVVPALPAADQPSTTPVPQVLVDLDAELADLPTWQQLADLYLIPHDSTGDHHAH